MSSVPAENDFLAVEPHIVARIRAALIDVTPAVHVLTATDLATVKELSQPVPAVHVLWRGCRVLETRYDGAAARLEHTWAVVAAVRNVRTLGSGADARAEAGALAARAGAALMGWTAPQTAGPFKLSGSPSAGPSAAGYFYLPLAFTVETVFGR
jgi:hypothetical protein